MSRHVTLREEAMNVRVVKCILRGMALRRTVGLVVVGLGLVGAPRAAAAQGAEPGPAVAPAPPVDAPGAPAAPPTSAPPGGAPAPGAPAAPPPSGLPSELAPTATRPGEPAKDPKGEGEGSRLTEIFWVNGEIGPSYVNMRQFSAENLAIENASGGGFMAGVGAGFRIVIVSLGFKLRWHKLSPFNLVQANGEVLFKLPISAVDVLIGAHGGYSGVGSLGDLFGSQGSAPAPASQALADSVSVRGWNAGLDVGFDYFLNNYVSLGLGLSGDFLSLQRPKSDISALPEEIQAQVKDSPYYQYDGKSLGFGVAGGLRLGLHLGP